MHDNDANLAIAFLAELRQIHALALPSTEMTVIENQILKTVGQIDAYISRNNNV